VLLVASHPAENNTAVRTSATTVPLMLVIIVFLSFGLFV
jgi:hypothetical protein